VPKWGEWLRKISHQIGPFLHITRHPVERISCPNKAMNAATTAYTREANIRAKSRKETEARSGKEAIKEQIHKGCMVSVQKVRDTIDEESRQNPVFAGCPVECTQQIGVFVKGSLKIMQSSDLQ
jgi:hypothetical protein